KAGTAAIQENKESKDHRLPKADREPRPASPAHHIVQADSSLPAQNAHPVLPRAAQISAHVLVLAPARKTAGYARPSPRFVRPHSAPSRFHTARTRKICPVPSYPPG